MSAAGLVPAAGENEVSSALAAAIHLSVHLAALGHDRASRVVRAAGDVAELVASGFTVTNTTHEVRELYEAVVDIVVGMMREGLPRLDCERAWGVIRAAARVVEVLDEGDIVHAGSERGRALLEALGTRGDARGGGP